MTTTKSYENARFIEEQMTEAANKTTEALKAVRAAIEAIKSGENHPDEKLSDFTALEGTLMLTVRAARSTESYWSGYAIARAKR